MTFCRTLLQKTTMILAAGTLLFGGQAYADDYSEFQVSYQGDLEMGCLALSREVNTMNEMISLTNGVQDDVALRNTGVAVAGAVGSFLVTTVTGGIGVMAAGKIMSHVNDGRGDDAELLQDIAEQRRSFMKGIYNAKGCQGPLMPSDAEALANLSPSSESSAKIVMANNASYNE